MNLLNLGQTNVGFLTGPQTNVAVISQRAPYYPYYGYGLNVANVAQTNIGFGSGPQTNVAVISQR